MADPARHCHQHHHQGHQDHQNQDLVVALYDFTSPSPSCLSFRTGDLIGVVGRHPSGWWDGVIAASGQRGWVPNSLMGPYTETLAAQSGAGQRKEARIPTTAHHPSKQRQQYHGSQRPSAQVLFAGDAMSPQLPSGSRDNSLPMSTRDESHQCFAILHDAISQVCATAQTGSLEQVQEATASLISIIRGILSTASRIKQDTRILDTPPCVDHNRNKVLLALHRLVKETRRASNPSLAHGRAHYTHTIVSFAHDVHFYMRSFLNTVAMCTTPLPANKKAEMSLPSDDPSQDADIHALLWRSGHRKANRKSMQEHERGGGGRAQEMDPSPSTAFISTDDSRAGSAKTFDPVHAKSGKPYPIEHGFLSHSSSSRTDSVETFRSLHEKLCRPSSSEHDLSSHSSTFTSNSATSSETDNCIKSEVIILNEYPVSQILQLLNKVNDELLLHTTTFLDQISTVSSLPRRNWFTAVVPRASSVAQAVHTLLVLVEAVCCHEGLQLTKPHETQLLKETSSMLQAVTTSLMTTLTSCGPVKSSGSKKGKDNACSGEPDAYGEAGSSCSARPDVLIRAATAVLRTGGECVGEVKLCLDKDNKTLRIKLDQKAVPLCQGQPHSAKVSPGNVTSHNRATSNLRQPPPANFVRSEGLSSPLALGQKVSSLSLSDARLPIRGKAVQLDRLAYPPPGETLLSEQRKSEQRLSGAVLRSKAGALTGDLSTISPEEEQQYQSSIASATTVGCSLFSPQSSAMSSNTSRSSILSPAPSSGGAPTELPKHPISCEPSAENALSFLHAALPRTETRLEVTPPSHILDVHRSESSLQRAGMRQGMPRQLFEPSLSNSKYPASGTTHRPSPSSAVPEPPYWFLTERRRVHETSRAARRSSCPRPPTGRFLLSAWDHEPTTGGPLCSAAGLSATTTGGASLPTRVSPRPATSMPPPKAADGKSIVSSVPTTLAYSALQTSREIYHKYTSSGS